ncbi:hypothetical protein BDR26DRAFT_1005821 [Obelidium mucronatum]|nr:hypothetical protein BDR26DRAFT_1005821 [Obelidium mucronatum]
MMSTQIPAMTKKQLSQYFERIRLPSSFCTAPATLDTLDTIVRHHASSIPFENTELLLLNKPGPIQLDKIFDRLVVEKRGGYCFQNNLLVVSALLSMGFRVSPGIASLSYWDASENEFKYKNPLHMILFVHIGASKYLVDLGGFRWSRAVLVSHNSTVVCAGGETYQLRKMMGECWILFHKRAPWAPLADGVQRDGFTPVFSFTDKVASLKEYEDLNRRVALDPTHKLKNTLLVSIITPSFGNAVITDTVYRRRELRENSSLEATIKMGGVNRLHSLLKEVFGIELSLQESIAAEVVFF